MGEAMHFYKQGELLYLPESMIDRAAEMQRKHTEEHPWVSIIEDYLERPRPENWSKMNKNERIYWLNDNEVEDEDIFKADSTRLIGRVCLLEIWHEALRKREAIDERSAVVIRNIMANMDGWKEEKELKRYAAYGRQRKGYFRIGSPFWK